MPKYLFLFLGLLLAHTGTAQQNQVSAKPPLTTVTIYLNGTGLEHRGTVVLAAGLNRIAVSGLSYRLREGNLEVLLGEGAELLSVDGEEVAAVANDEEEKPQPVVRSKATLASLARLAARISRAEAELVGLRQERGFLLGNQTLPAGTQANWSAEVQKGAALLRTRLPANQLETERLETRLRNLRAANEALQAPPTTGPVPDEADEVLLVRATRAGTVDLTLRYYVAVGHQYQNWLPKLDIRADAAGRELEFVTHGQLRNLSGLDWRKVHLVLLRQVLDEDVSRPTLVPWKLDFQNNGDKLGEGRVDAFVVKGTAKGRPADLVQSTRYEVPELVSLPYRARRELILPAVKLAGRPEYLAVPRLSEHVILQAKVAGWEGLQLPDHAYVYHQGRYVGATELDPAAYNDSLEVVLGHDDNLVVSRAKLNDFSSNVGLSDQRRVELTYELNVRNRHPEAVRLRLIDQIPITEEEKISVKLLDASGAVLDARTGKLTWLLTVPAGGSQRVKFSFQVDYPKNQKVEIINHRVNISMPKTR